MKNIDRMAKAMKDPKNHDMCCSTCGATSCDMTRARAALLAIEPDAAMVAAFSTAFHAAAESELEMVDPIVAGLRAAFRQIAEE